MPPVDAVPAADLSGTTLSHTYRLISLLGSGGMGDVYLGQHLRTEGPVAVKVLRGAAQVMPELFRRFQAEARLLCRLRHGCFVQVFDLNQDQGLHYLVMERLVGEDLEQRLQRRGVLPVRELMTLLRELGAALQAAHDNEIIHRDIKPQNIFMHQGIDQRAEEQVKVLDFGIAKIRQHLSLRTQDGAILGTPHYLSPEVAGGHGQTVDGRADQWAVAVLAYRALSGRLPFTGENLAAICYHIVHTPTPLMPSSCPPPLAAALRRALSKDPAARFPSMRDFVNACAPAGGALGASPGSPGSSQRRFCGAALAIAAAFSLGLRVASPATDSKEPLLAQGTPACTCPPAALCPPLLPCAASKVCTPPASADQPERRPLRPARRSPPSVPEPLIWVVPKADGK